MAATVLINGYPGSGKSTVAAAVSEQLSGSLWCDVDDLVERLTPFAEEHPGLAARRIVTAMIVHQAEAERSIVISQLIAVQDAVDRWRAAATGAGSPFVEVVLSADRDIAFDRVVERSGHQLAGLGDPETARLRFDDLCDRLDERLSRTTNVSLVPARDFASTVDDVLELVSG